MKKYYSEEFEGTGILISKETTMCPLIEYRLIYNKTVDLDFTCFCSEDRVCGPCEERGTFSSNWYDLPFYNLSSHNKLLPHWGVFSENRLYEMLEELEYIYEDDYDYNDAQEVISVIRSLIDEIGYACFIEIRWE